MNKKTEVIFFGNGALAEYALAVLANECQVIFHARTAEDLATAVELKKSHPEAHGVLASYGILIPDSVLEVFESEGILNIHPSLLPLYRGPSPIESAILAGDNDFGVSVMKLAPEMDAGPIYYQTSVTGLPLCKNEIYKVLASAGAEWIASHLGDLSKPVLQDESRATYTSKLDKKMGILTPETDTAETTFRKIVAFQGFPKPKFAFYGVPCIILDAHALEQDETAPLTIPCADGRAVAVDILQPEGRKAMDTKSFLNGLVNKK